MEDDSLLKIEDLSVQFGGLAALTDFNLKVNRGEIRGIIGPNGAGKTTLFNVISRFYDPSRGKIWFAGKNHLEYRAHQIIGLGIARTFQKSELFKSMSVLENVQMGLHMRMKGNFLTTSVQLKGVREEEKQSQEESRKILEILSLKEYEGMPASVIPVAKQKVLEIGRAIASHPKLLLLDEPASGMTYGEKVNLTELLLKIREQMHLTILIVEHDMKVVMNISDQLTVLNYGRIIAEGKPAEVRNNPLVIEAYMGKSREI